MESLVACNIWFFVCGSLAVHICVYCNRADHEKWSFPIFPSLLLTPLSADAYIARLGALLPRSRWWVFPHLASPRHRPFREKGARRRSQRSSCSRGTAGRIAPIPGCSSCIRLGGDGAADGSGNGLAAAPQGAASLSSSVELSSALLQLSSGNHRLSRPYRLQEAAVIINFAPEPAAAASPSPRRSLSERKEMLCWSPSGAQRPSTVFRFPLLGTAVAVSSARETALQAVQARTSRDTARYV